jgi:hypothetical protein
VASGLFPNYAFKSLEEIKKKNWSLTHHRDAGLIGKENSQDIKIYLAVKSFYYSVKFESPCSS